MMTWIKFSVISVFSVILIFSSCLPKKKSQLPMDMDKVITLLADIRLSSQVVKYFDKEDRDSMQAIYMDSIYRVHRVDTTQYKELMNYLEQNVAEYYGIEQKVHSKLKSYMDEPSKE